MRKKTKCPRCLAKLLLHYMCTECGWVQAQPELDKAWQHWCVCAEPKDDKWRPGAKPCPLCRDHWDRQQAQKDRERKSP